MFHSTCLCTDCENELRPKLLELFAGIGGATVAFQNFVDVIAAIDINDNAKSVYQTNFSHPYLTLSIESLSASRLQAFNADIWWMSPPCQPFTRRGLRRDDRDPRSAALKNLIDILDIAGPATLMLENVVGFQKSKMHSRLITKLTSCDYHIHEYLLCPTDFGIPNNRPRYYLLASKTPVKKLNFKNPEPKHLVDFLDTKVDERFWIERELLGGKINGLNVVTPKSDSSICFTSSYGRWMRISGSFIQCGERIRRFTPREILRILGFPEAFKLPTSLTDSQLWKLIGNSISVFVVQRLLSPYVGSEFLRPSSK